MASVNACRCCVVLCSWNVDMNMMACVLVCGGIANTDGAVNATVCAKWAMYGLVVSILADIVTPRDRHLKYPSCKQFMILFYYD